MESAILRGGYFRVVSDIISVILFIMPVLELDGDSGASWCNYRHNPGFGGRE